MRAELRLSVCLLTAAALVWTGTKLWRQSSTSLPGLSAAPDSGLGQASATRESGPDRPEGSAVKAGLSDQRAIDLLRRSVAQLRTAPPLVAQLDLQINLLQREFQGSGQYCQTGSGNPQARWDLVLGSQSEGLRLAQIFDGRFFYRLTIQGANRTLSYVDLYSVRDLRVVETEGVAGLPGWLGVGGLPTMLEQLLATHEFDPPGEPELVQGADGQSLTLVRIRGRWSKTALRQLLRDQVSPEALAGEILWDQLPGQLPHAVELVLGSDHYLDAFPYQLTCYQFREGKENEAAQPIFELKLHHVEKREAIAPEQFRLSADGLNPVDDTKDYLSRVKLFTLYPLK